MLGQIKTGSVIEVIHRLQGRSAIVVGAGIGGLAAAVQLRRAGWNVRVLEQALELAEIGAGIQLAPNATRVLSSLGAIDRLEKFAVAPGGVVWRRWVDGSCLNRDQLGGEAATEFGSPYWHVHRADLHRVLFDIARESPGLGEPVRIELGRKVGFNIRQDSHEVVATTVAGEEYAADLLVGADGIHSEVRRLFQAEDRPVYSGDCAFRALVSVDDIRELKRLYDMVSEPLTTLWVGPRRHVVHYKVRAGELINIVALVNTAERAAESWMAPATATELMDAFHGWDVSLLDLFSKAETIQYSGVYDRSPLEHWVQGRIALVGDSCHAMLPYMAQGAAQALEDVAALGEVLADARPNEIDERLRSYEMTRRPRAAAVQEASRASQSLLHLDDGESQRARDDNLKVAAREDAYGRYRWLWADGRNGEM